MRLSCVLGWMTTMIAIGCGEAAPDQNDDTSGASSSSTAAGTSSGTSSEPGTEGTITGSTSETTSEGTSSSDGGTTAVAESSSGSESESSSDDESSSSSDSGEPHVACTDGCEIEFTCGMQWDSAEACSTWCEDNLDQAALFSPFCMTAWENLSACFATLDCEQYAAYLAAKVLPYPCSDEADELAFECDGQ